MAENRFAKYAQQGVQTRPADPTMPFKAPAAAADLTGQNLTNQGKVNDLRNAPIEREGKVENIKDTRFDNRRAIRDEYNALPIVKNYPTVLSSAAGAMRAPENPQGDLAVLYAFAQVMDPGSVVRESEQQMAERTASVLAQLRLKYDMVQDGKGLPKGVRPGLIDSMRQKVGAINEFYSQSYGRYRDIAKRNGMDPEEITGAHLADSYKPIEAQYIKSKGGTPRDAEMQRFVRENANMKPDDMRAAFKSEFGKDLPNAPDVLKHLRATGQLGDVQHKAGYDQSALSQGLSGINEGIAGLAGAPVDLATGALNLIPRGVNALANTNIPTIDNPTLGSQWIKDRFASAGMTGPAPKTRGLQSLRRVGESLGAAIPVAGAAGSLAKGGGQLLAGMGGGLGAAGAQQAFPGNPLAEMAGEVAGGGLTAGGLLGAARHQATNKVRAAVPTIEQLKEKAGGLYRAAEARGVVADGTQTQTLADTVRAALAKEGSVSPTGRISEVYPKAREAMQLADDYAGQPMNPTQMQTVRKVMADGLSSPEATDRRLGGILTDSFDGWANPLAPELEQARDVSSRYLTAQQLEKARELAGVDASQFTGSGFENALRKHYRGLDRGAVKGSKHFTDDVTNAIETVSRGTPASNFARGLGKLAPTGVVPLGLGSALPAGLTMMAGGGGLGGAAVGAGMAGLGTLGRIGATGMGIRAADTAELVARNGGALPRVDLMTPEMMQLLSAYAASESAKYLTPENQAAVDQGGYPYPDPLARRKGQRHLLRSPR